MSSACDDRKRAIIFYPSSTMWFEILKENGQKGHKSEKKRLSF
jgi:hypothetical protein